MLSKMPHYKIRQVVDITGASEFLIRTWELRYKALSPARTPTGRRLYSEKDILKIRALLTLTRLGHRVGEVAHKNLAELEQLVANKSPTTTLNIQASPQAKTILAAAKSFEWDKVQELVNKSDKKKSPLKWIHQIIIPLITEMGRDVLEGRLSIAQEHILSATIKDSLVSAFSYKARKNSQSRIVLAAPEGDYHDLGILMASRMANHLGANTLYLGPHMPKDELAAVCLRYKATHLLLSSTSPTKSETQNDFFSYVNFLDRNIKPKISFWLAGPNAKKYPLSLKRPFKIIDSFETLENEVRNCL